MFIRVLLNILVIGLVFTLAKKLLSLGSGRSNPSVKGRRPPDGSRTVEGGRMVKDPTCKTYVTEEKALRARIGGQDYFFCSQDCLDQFKATDGAES